jgi:predicted nucleic acid-binding protein
VRLIGLVAYRCRMAKRANDLGTDPVIVVIPDDFDVTFDEWLATLRRDEPLKLPVTSAQLVAEAKFPLSATWWVPEHYFVEVAGAIRRAELNGTVTPALAAIAFAGLRTAPLKRVQIRPLLPEAWAMRGHVTMGDALYVVLAMHLGATLVTADIKLANSPHLPVPVLRP